MFCILDETKEESRNDDLDIVPSGKVSERTSAFHVSSLPTPSAKECPEDFFTGSLFKWVFWGENNEWAVRGVGSFWETGGQQVILVFAPDLSHKPYVEV